MIFSRQEHDRLKGPGDREIVGYLLVQSGLQVEPREIHPSSLPQMLSSLPDLKRSDVFEHTMPRRYIVVGLRAAINLSRFELSRSKSVY